FPLCGRSGGEGGAHREAMGGWGGCQWGRRRLAGMPAGGRRSLWNPPPHPDPLRPQGRRGNYRGAPGVTVPAWVEVQLAVGGALKLARGDRRGLGFFHTSI